MIGVVHVLMRGGVALAAALGSAEGIYETREAAQAAKDKVLNTGKTTTSNMQDWTIFEVPFYFGDKYILCG
jgi:hypothetical protein